MLTAHLLPRCWVPAELREQVLHPHHATGTKGFFRQPPRCRECRERDRCPGITHAALEQLGPECVSPIQP